VKFLACTKLHLLSGTWALPLNAKKGREAGESWHWKSSNEKLSKPHASLPLRLAHFLPTMFPLRCSGGVKICYRLISPSFRTLSVTANLPVMLSSLFSVLNDASRDRKSWQTSNHNGWRDMLQRNWYLGLTSFGGPAVHFQIVRNTIQIPLSTDFGAKHLPSSDDYLWKITNGSMTRWYEITTRSLGRLVARISCLVLFSTKSFSRYARPSLVQGAPR